MELEDKDERTFEDFLAFLQLHLELKTWEIGSEPILSLPGLQIYPDRICKVLASWSENRQEKAAA